MYLLSLCQKCGINSTIPYTESGFQDKVRAIKGLVVLNGWDLEPLVLLNGLSLCCSQLRPMVFHKSMEVHNTEYNMGFPRLLYQIHNNIFYNIIPVYILVEILFDELWRNSSGFGEIYFEIKIKVSTYDLSFNQNLNRNFMYIKFLFSIKDYYVFIHKEIE